MTYSATAIERRRCRGTRKDGDPCKAWALWGHPDQVCLSHSERRHRGPMALHRRSFATRYVPCTCDAYAWPHRPGGGDCEWPDPPRYRCTTPAGTHGEYRVRRRPDGW